VSASSQLPASSASSPERYVSGNPFEKALFHGAEPATHSNADTNKAIIRCACMSDHLCATVLREDRPTGIPGAGVKDCAPLQGYGNPICTRVGRFHPWGTTHAGSWSSINNRSAGRRAASSPAAVEGETPLHLPTSPMRDSKGLALTVEGYIYQISDSESKGGSRWTFST